LHLSCQLFRLDGGATKRAKLSQKSGRRGSILT
jgi:hypothetical protein